jgi:glycosyltransferase involved in cell wall biosynthesis
MPSPPLVTIGIPVRNGARFIRDALDSAIAQDYPQLEILVSDNASTDETRAIVQDYAQRDPRIRYWRNPTNIGLVPNFGRVLAEARGEYFTWLACDDILSYRNYVTKTVAFLEANPDVGLCSTDFDMLDLAGPGKVLPWRFPEIYPDRDPAEVRALYFSWPQAPACFAVYGVGRRDVMAKASFNGRKHRGRFAVTHMEYPILLAVLKQARIVALPEVLRTYRRNPQSAYHRETDRMSGLDYVRLGLQTKMMLLRKALSFPLPAEERRRLLRRVLANFVPRTVRSARGEAKRLRIAAEERRQLILSLRQVVAERRDLVVTHGLEPRSRPVRPGLSEDDLAPPGEAPPAPSRLPPWAEPIRDAAETLFTDFFRRPSAEHQARRRKDMVDSLVLRQLCEDRLEEIHHLNAEAERYLSIMQQAEAARRSA